jgi:hypothetical protein
MLETDTTAASVTSKATYPVFISNETTELKWLYKYYERLKSITKFTERPFREAA